jgi:signal transduction histidine kinase
MRAPQSPHLSSGGSSTSAAPRRSPSSVVQRFWRHPLLPSAFLVAGVIILYQLVVTILQPDWLGAVTDWLRSALSLPELLIVVLVSWQLTRRHAPEVRSWWMLSAAFVSYTIARNFWTIDGRFIYAGHVPFPTYPDIFFILQYPFFFLALILLPGVPPWGARVRVILDCLLLMGAASALSWYFILAPIYLQSGESVPGKIVNLAYPLADLCLLFGLTVALIYRRCSLTRTVLLLLIAAVICLVIADGWAAYVILYPQHFYGTGHPSDLFWISFYLLVPLAMLVQLRLTRFKAPTTPETRTNTRERRPIQGQDVREAFRFLSPFVAALVASIVIGFRAIIHPITPMSPLAPSLVILGLLFLVFIRQGVTLLENAQLRRERQAARANEQAAQAREQGAREASRQMEAFLGIASHELKTPLSSILLGLQTIQRRLQRQAAGLAGPTGEGTGTLATSQGMLEVTIQQLGRLNRLVNDLVDISRIQSGRLEFKFKPADLAAIVALVVQEQRQTAPERTILLGDLPGRPVLVCGDEERIGQVITNYLTNALKYSDETAPVEVGLRVEGAEARVWVRDQGPGIPPEEQAHIWERFHRVAGIEVQSGSGIGLGLGLHISKTIIERHHGQVGVESVPGQGATFWFTLPLVVSAARAHEPGEDAARPPFAE